MFYVYILRCRDGSLYTGYTDDLNKRLSKHSQGLGAKYTRSRLPVVLVYSEEYADKREAMSREKYIQRLTRSKKLALIGGKSEDREVPLITNPQIAIRDAVLTDLPDIVAIYNSTIPSRMVTADLSLITIEQRLPWFEEHSPERLPLWIALDKDEIVAWLSFQLFNKKPAYHITAELSIYVKEGRRKQGLASLLLTKALAQCPRLGFKNVVGLVFGHNQPSLQLFSQFGFQRWGTLPGVAELDGQARDLVIVGRSVHVKEEGDIKI